MTLNEYQTRAARTIACTNSADMRMHALLGLASETGELMDALYLSEPLNDEQAKREMGDIMWMVAEYCTANGWFLAEVIKKPDPVEYDEFEFAELCKAVGMLTGYYQKIYQGHLVDSDKAQKAVRGIYKALYTMTRFYDTSIDEILQMNIDKLLKRYPDGFDNTRSLHRSDGDL